MSGSHKNVTHGVNVIRKSWSHQNTWRWEKFSDVAQIMDIGRMQIQQIIKRKSEVLDNYESNVSNDRKRRNSFNSGIYFKNCEPWLNYRSPLLSSQFLPALKWLLKSNLTVYQFKSDSFNMKLTIYCKLCVFKELTLFLLEVVFSTTTSVFKAVSTESTLMTYT